MNHTQRNQPEKRRYSQRKHREPLPETPLWFVSLNNLLDELENQRKIRELDRIFALFVAKEYLKRESNEHPDNILAVCMLAALLSEQLGQQQVCLPLENIPSVFAPLYRFAEESVLTVAVKSSPFAAKTAGEANEVGALTLFRLEQGRLYLSRYWHYEQNVVGKWKTFVSPAFETDHIRSLLTRLYPATPDQQEHTQEINWQKVAIALACLKPSCVIAGGPGTGKTTTVVRILWMLSKLYQRSDNKYPIIRMVAPTGKAAARLSESVSNALNNLPDKDSAIPTECSTIHRLLGTIPGSNFFRHNKTRLLNLDVLVVDEASMIDLPLLAKMLEALPAHCRLVILGDSHQLASVEVGSVFSDICSLKPPENVFSTSTARQLWQVLGKSRYESLLADDNQISENSFQNHIIYLKKSYRFDATKGIGHLAGAINAGNVSATMSALENTSPTLTWHQNARPALLVDMVMAHFKRFHQVVVQGDVAKAFEILTESQILAIQKTGKWGVEAINHLVLQALVAEKLIDKGTEFYAGRPVMVTSNDHQNKLFNGDIGIVFAAEDVGAAQGMSKVWFPDGKGGFRSILPAQLPPHQTFYAMTTHKSQGSEFTKVILCMPDPQEGNIALLNRELLYTAVTRSREEFVLFAHRESIRTSVINRCQRSSGLAEILE